jgi:LCP family protein required for cell wall assembly
MRKFIFIAIGILAAAIVIGGLVIYPKAKGEWSAPLGPGLELPTHTAPALSPTVTDSPSTPIAETNALTFEFTPTATGVPETVTITPTATPEPLCGGPVVMTILAVGADSGYDYRYGLADVIRIVRVDFVTPKVTVLSMPRDLWVELPPGIASPSGNVITHSKLNQSYFYGGPGMGYYDGPGAGPGLLARALSLNFGLRVDHYGAVNMQSFVKMVDAVGGIDLYLPYDVDGRPVDNKTADMGYFYAGQRHFNGDQALRFARIRKKYNDFTRMDHQNMVICALKEKITSPAVLPKIPQIINAFQDSVLTDLSPEQFSQLACLAPKLNRENLLFTSLPREILDSGNVYSPILKNSTYIVDADFDIVRDYVDQFMAGTWPDQPKEPTCP